jgi:hypothetical protein
VELFASFEQGVGHIRLPTTVSKFGKRFGLFAVSGVIVDAIAVQLRGVGHDNDSVSPVIGTHTGC